jgi:hypothetical protein
MPVTYQLDPEAGRVETRCTGGVTLDDVLAHFRALEADPALPQRLHVLLDLTEMTSLPDRIQLKSVTRAVDQLCDRLRWGACAIVASRDALFGMSRMFEVFTEGLFAQTHVFRGRGEAERWLAAEMARSRG